MQTIELNQQQVYWLKRELERMLEEAERDISSQFDKNIMVALLAKLNELQ